MSYVQRVMTFYGYEPMPRAALTRPYWRKRSTNPASY